MNDTQELGRAIRELLDQYTPPPDPYGWVSRRVRARRNRRVAAGLVATVSVAFALLVAIAMAPSGEVTFRPLEVAAPPPAVASGDQFAEFGAGSALEPAYVVSRGSVNGRAYVVASTTFGLRGAACLFAADAVFNRLSWCSAALRPGEIGEWDLLEPVRADAEVVAVGGIVQAGVRAVVLRLGDGRELAAPAVRTPTSQRVAYFVIVLPNAGTEVAGVLADSAGKRVPLPRSVADGRCAGSQLPAPESAGPAAACPANGDEATGRRS